MHQVILNTTISCISNVVLHLSMWVFCV